MTHLYIELNTGLTEEVNSPIISKLYEIASSGDLDLTSNLTGRLHTSLSYRDESEYLTTTYPNLFISSDEYSIRFEDPNMLTFLLLRGIGSNGIITESLAAAALMVSNAASNNVIVKFNELRYFTKVTESAGGFNGALSGKCKFASWRQLLEIDISNFTSIGHSNTTDYQDTFLNCALLKTVTASNKLLAIGYSVFSMCPKLETISGLSGEIVLGGSAFYNCSKLTSDNFEDVEFVIGTLPLTIGSEFNNCSSLTKIICSTKTLKINATFNGCSNLEEIEGLSNVAIIENGAFLGCGKLETIDLDFSKIEEIHSPSNRPIFSKDILLSYNLPSTLNLSSLRLLDNSSCFKGQFSLTTVSSLGFLETLPNYTFLNCVNLTSVTFPETLQTIGDYAFNGCSSLTTINNISNCNLQTIGTLAFISCPITGSITFKEGLVSIGLLAFSNSSISSLTFPSTLKNLNLLVFLNNYQLTSVTFANNTVLDNLSTLAFRYCTSLTTLNNFPKVTNIYDYTFLGCPITSSITFKEGLESIGTYAFAGNLFSSITFPDSLTTIGDYAFKDCTQATSITFGEGIENIGKAAFLNNKVTTLSFPSTLKTINLDAFREDTLLTSVTFAENTTLDTLGLYAFDGDTSLTTLNNFPYVENIPLNCFLKCPITGSIVFKEGLETIGNYAFRGCLFSSITLPSTLEVLHAGAFYGDTQLTSITFSEGLKTIREQAFYGCSNLATLTLPNSVEYIYENAFVQNIISSISLPSSLKVLYLNAFSGNYQAPFEEKIRIPEGCYFATAKLFSRTGTKYIEWPSTITDMEASFYYYDVYLNTQAIWILKATTPPTLGAWLYSPSLGWHINYDDPNDPGMGYFNDNKNYISHILALYVPDASLSAYLSATGVMWTLPELQAKLKPISDLLTDSPTYWAVYQAGLSTP